MVFPLEEGTSVSQEEPMRSCITHFSWPDAGLCEVPSKPTLARAKGVGRYMCVFLCKCVCVCIYTHAIHFVIRSKEGLCTYVLRRNTACLSACLRKLIDLTIGSSSLLCFPAGSRVSTELHYTREKQGEESVFTSQMLIQTPKKEGTNILTQEALLVHMEAALSASKVQVSLFGK